MSQQSGSEAGILKLRSRITGQLVNREKSIQLLDGIVGKRLIWTFGVQVVSNARMALVKSSAEARKDNADNSIVKQTTRTAVIIFCKLTNHQEATKCHFMNSHPSALFSFGEEFAQGLDGAAQALLRGVLARAE